MFCKQVERTRLGFAYRRSMRTSSLCILSLLSMTAAWLFGGEEASPRFFPGGGSDISSNAANRAELSTRKWSDPMAWEETDPTEAPYFWDFDVVGRPVYLRVFKNGNRSGELEVWLEDPQTKKYAKFKTYRIAYFSGQLGPKTKQGDMQAPEGFYFINRGRMNPASSYHLSMDMGYPNTYDRFHERTGSLLMIHGKAVSLGCFAMSDASIEQIYTLVDAAMKNGQSVIRVHSFPFPMTEKVLARKSESDHHEFWTNLKEGYDWFEKHRVPPDVTVKDGRYVFSSLR